jgi:metallo-beta-lactamase family protein
LRLTFNGAAGTVTGSQHLLEANGKKILLDCGMHQGHREESERKNRSFPFNPADVDAIILSHAHIDHSGNLPTAVKKGFTGLVLSTFATRDLAAIMLPDSAHIQKYDTEYINRKRARKALPPIEPLYDINDVMNALERFMSIPYGRSWELFPGISIRFLDAGHILGAAQVELTVREKGKELVLLYTGDLGRASRPILKDPDVSSRPDILIMESTYGGRNHGPREATASRFREVVHKTASRGGKLIIPSFSVGRTQEVLFYIHELTEADDMPDIPVYVDSPLSFDATEVYKLHPECFDSEMRELLQAGHSPFQFEGLHFIQGVRESKALNQMDQPMVIISASGMCENGRILHHLKNNVSDPRCTVLIVGFMAANTLGRRIVEKEETLSIFGEDYRRKAEVEVINGFSAHADSDDLMWFWKTVGERTERVILVHGEEDQSESLSRRIRDESGKDVHIAVLGETLELT